MGLGSGGEVEGEAEAAEELEAAEGEGGGSLSLEAGDRQAWAGFAAERRLEVGADAEVEAAAVEGDPVAGGEAEGDAEQGARRAAIGGAYDPNRALRAAHLPRLDAEEGEERHLEAAAAEGGADAEGEADAEQAEGLARA